MISGSATHACVGPHAVRGVVLAPNSGSFPWKLMRPDTLDIAAAMIGLGKEGNQLTSDFGSSGLVAAACISASGVRSNASN